MLKRDLNVRIATQIRKLLRRIAEETDESALLLKAEAARTVADSLLASAHLSATEDNTLVIPNVYDPSAMLRVAIPRGKNSRDIANDYYGRARRLELRAKESKAAKERFEKKLEELNVLQAQLSSVTGLKDLERLSKRFESGAAEAGKKVLPGVAVHHVEGFEVWVGKSAAGNDLILQQSHKDDIWMHARSAAGAHVLIRMQRKNSVPPTSILEKAASWAAWRSKSRGAALVPVQWTYRKFVRKPKGAASGMVIVQREHVLMVAPSAEPDQNDLE
jgi:predicted ribosome quality control (RQC) complex YloA/Tae2 family protein